jgi:uncharacterized protein YegL
MYSRALNCLAVFLVAEICSAFSPDRLNQGWIIRRSTRDISDIDVTNSAAQDEKANTDTSPRIYSMDIESDIRLRYASTKVSSRVANSAAKAQETTFHVVLPETAFISGFLMEIDGKIYKASVKEKEEAKTEYDNAVSLGQTAAQVSTNARDSNQFTVSVNIEPKAKVTFNLTYEELLTRRRGVYEHAININPGSVVPRLATRINIHEILPISYINILPFQNNDIEDNINTLNETATVTRTNATAASIIFQPTESQQKKMSSNGLQGQFTIQYDVDRSSIERQGGEIHVVDGYFVHFFAPSSLPALPKHVVFVLDTSGSMQGLRLDQTKQAMESILDQLRPEDVFSVVEFSSYVKEWNLTGTHSSPEGDREYYQPYSPDGTLPEKPAKVSEAGKEPIGPYDNILAYPVSNRSVSRAKEFVQHMEATGGTNINEALLTALNNTQSLQSRLKLTPMIIFLTDGEATSGETQADVILNNVRRANSDQNVPIFSLAFGRGADFGFLTKVSRNNRAFARKIYEASDATLQLRGFFEEVASPLLNNVRFSYQGQVEGKTTATELTNFFGGSEFVVTGLVPKDQDKPLKAEVKADAASGPYLVTDILTFVNRTEKNKTSENNETQGFSLEKIWAYLTIQQLLKKSEIDDKDVAAILKDKALNLSLSYGFVTPLTSLLVVKPNENASSTDVAPADLNPVDGSGGLKFSTLGLNAARPISLAAVAPLPDPQFFAPESYQPVAIRTTTPLPKFPSFTQPPVSIDPVQAEELIPEAPLNDNLLKWIDSFTHNETHVNLPFDNSTQSLIWTNELSSLDYQKCNETESTNDEGTITVFCKSIWHCSNAEQLLVNQKDTTNVCIIENKYVGVCCFNQQPKTE